MPLNEEAVTLGALAKPGATQSLEVNVNAPPWLAALPPGGALPCWSVSPELFFPFRYNLQCKDQIDAAKAVCEGCPVRDLCLDWALAVPDIEGIWAGTIPLERRRIRTGRKPRPAWAQRKEAVA